MTYESINQELKLKAETQATMSKKAKLFLEASNLPEYLVERDLQMPDCRSRLWWLDEFVIYWMVKEHFALWLLCVAIASLALTVALGIAFSWMGCKWLAFSQILVVGLVVAIVQFVVIEISRYVKHCRLDYLKIDRYYCHGLRGAPFREFGELDEALSMHKAEEMVDKLERQLND